MLVSNEFRPDPRVMKEARSLARGGHYVQVYAWDREGSGLPEEQVIDGIRIRRFRIPSQYGSGLSQLPQYIKTYQLIVSSVTECYDVIHCHDIDFLPLGIRLQRIFSAALICDLHEFYSLCGSKPVRFANIIVEKQLLPKVSGIIYISETQKEYYHMPYIPSIVLPNYPEKSLFEGYRCDRARQALTVGYIGSVRYAEDLFRLIDACSLLGGMRVLIAGAGVKATEVRHYASKFSFVEVSGPFTYPETPRLYQKVDVVYAVYSSNNPHDQVQYAMPVKVWEALCTGKPVIVAKGTHVGEFISRAHAGIAVDPTIEDISVALKAIGEEYDYYASAARTLGMSYTWEVIEGNLLSFYRSFEQ